MDFIPNLINSVVEVLIAILPDSPFLTILENMQVANTFLPAVNYFLPVSLFMLLMKFWLGAIAIYYIYRTILRWAGVD